MKINPNTAQNNRYAEGITENAAARKFMDRAEKGEKVNLFQEVGTGAVVELSKEGMDELNKKIAEMKSEQPGIRALSYEEKVKLLQESIKPVRKLHRIIPNIQTNDKLVRSLQGADENTIDEAYAIIDKHFLPHNIGNMTEKERRDLIRAGVEKAKSLAKDLEDGKADLFMEAMTTIAKYGVNGKTNSEGNVTYDIRWGALVGAPDDYISSGELMKKIDPKQYAVYTEMMNEAHAKNDDHLYVKAVKFMMDWEMKAYRDNPAPFERIKEDQVNWKKNVDATEI